MIFAFFFIFYNFEFSGGKSIPEMLYFLILSLKNKGIFDLKNPDQDENEGEKLVKSIIF